MGYEVSPVLWRAVDKARSAGRVQSVAIRLVCERERERMAFRSATWFDVTATLTSGDATFEATLETVNGAPLATGKNFDAAGALEAKALELLSEGAANSIAQRLPGSSLEVAIDHLDAAHAATPGAVHDVVPADRGESQAAL